MKNQFLIKVLILLVFFNFFNLTNILAITNTGDDIEIIQNGTVIDIKDNLNIQPQMEAKTSQIFPSSYDLRNINGINYVTPVEFQNPWGVCWAFSAIEAAETNVLLQHPGIIPDLSVRAFADGAYSLQAKEDTPETEREGIYLTSPSGLNSPALRAGGNLRQSIAQMSTWNAASTSEQIPYQNDEGILSNSPIPGVPMYSPDGNWTIPYQDLFDNEYHLQNSAIFSNEDVETFNYYLKSTLINEGGVSINFTANRNYFNPNTGAWYNPQKQEPDHSVTVIGWDDNFSVNNFIPGAKPPFAGAWLCKNSWSSKWGLDGYFYLSYYDSTLTDAAYFNVETAESGYSYDNIYQYDYSGDRLGLSTTFGNLISKELYNDGISADDIAFGNIFTIDKPETLRAVSVYPELSGSEVSIDIYKLKDNPTNPTDGILMLSQKESFNHPGFYTIRLNETLDFQAGEKIGIVESISYNVNLDGSDVVLPGISIEYGLNGSLPVSLMIDDARKEEGKAFLNVVVNSGESFIYGLEQDSNSQLVWSDMSSETIQNYLSILYQDNLVFTPGNTMIKVYTNDLEASMTESFSISPEIIYLTTIPGQNNSQIVSSPITFEGNQDELVWCIAPPTVATISGSGNQATVTAKSEGEAIITVCSQARACAQAKVIVKNDPIIADQISIETTDPDSFSVILNNVRVNPAFNESSIVQNVSIFCWSDPNQEDLNAKRAVQEAGTNNWRVDNFPVNDNQQHLYFKNASKININTYASTDSGDNGYLVGSGVYNWVNKNSSGNHMVAYISYNQNLGFDKPTVFEGMQAGITDNPNISHIEGIRVSSNIEGLTITSKVHVADLGWLDFQEDGVYNGTMGQDKALEAIQLIPEGDNASQYNVIYRVFIKGYGWSEWANNGQIVGTTGQAIPIQAYEVRIDVK